MAQQAIRGNLLSATHFCDLLEPWLVLAYRYCYYSLAGNPGLAEQVAEHAVAAYIRQGLSSEKPAVDLLKAALRLLPSQPVSCTADISPAGRLAREMQWLTFDQRQAITLQVLLGLRATDAVAVMDCSVGRLRWLVWSALPRLTQFLRRQPAVQSQLP